MVLALATVAEASQEAFLSVSDASPYRAELREYADSLLRQQRTKPEWCLLGSEAGEPVARAALWSIKPDAAPTDIVLIDADWSDEDLSNGRELMAAIHDLARSSGADALSHSRRRARREPPQYQDHAEGPHPAPRWNQGTSCFATGSAGQYAASASYGDRGRKARSSFARLPEVGEDAFVEALASTYEGTRDSWMTREHRRARQAWRGPG